MILTIKLNVNNEVTITENGMRPSAHNIFRFKDGVNQRDIMLIALARYYGYEPSELLNLPIFGKKKRSRI